MNTPCIELLNTGNELLLGRVRDLHLSWFGKELFALGLRISRQVTVPDGSVIRDAVLESFHRADILIVTGGLGPTTDDITREIIAELLGLRLQFHQETLERIQELCRSANLDVYTSPRAPVGHIDSFDLFLRYMHEVASYTSMRLGLDESWIHRGE